MSGNLIHFDDGNFKAQIASGVTMVDLFTTWCGPCRSFAPVVQKLADAYAGRAKVGKMDVEQAPGASAPLGVTNVPTVIFFKDGQEMQRFSGVRSEREISAILDRLLAS